MVGGYRQRHVLPHGGHYVQIQRGGFHHQDVRAFRFIQLRFPQGFPDVAGVHLVRFLVPLLRRAFQRAAERPVQGAGVLGGIGHDGDVVQGLGIQGGADGGHAAVHHVAGGDDVRPGVRVAQSLAAENLHGVVIEDFHRAVGRDSTRPS